jgi:hypothetical protein
MANNDENQVILVNPNNALGKKGLPLDFKTSQPDDLTIYVELTTQKRSRSKIVDEGNRGFNENIDGSKGKINFISGSDFDGKNKSLTTSYTDISSASLKSNGEDLEGFGIESIDITFDTAYTPLIKIKFVDVRGGMFQRGNDSKYSVFFELPYPLFNLKVKGYYGRTVSYCLHLVKWNALFNSNTGNFEIDAEFIGYTFAILTDLLIGYLRAIPYVRGDGDNAFKSVKDRYEADLISSGDLAGNQVITIDDMFRIISDFQSNLNAINKNSDAFRKLVNVKKSVDAINNIKKRNSEFLFELQKENNNIPANSVGGSTISSILFVKNSSDDYNNYVNDMSTLIGELENFVSGISQVQKNLLKDAIVTDKILISDLFDAGSTPDNVILVNNPSEVIVNKVITSNTKYDVNDSSDANRLRNIIKSIEEGIYKNPSNLKLSETGFYVYDFYKFDKTINNVIDINSKVQSNLIVQYQEELRGKLKTVYDFNPSVQNIIRILMASAETFLIAVQKVAERASKNDLRRETLKNILTVNRNDGLSDIPLSDDTIYPFPLYVEKVTEGSKSQLEEAWIGGNQKIDTAVVDEIEFTEKLLVQLVERKVADINREVDFDNSSSWFSVNPLDSNIFLSSQNPYFKLNRTANSPDEYMRLLMYRTFTYLGLTNPYDKLLDENSLKYMAYVEANNLFYGFPKADYNTATVKTKTSLYDNYKDADSIINHWLTGSDKIKNIYGRSEKIPYINKNTDGYVYDYVRQVVGTSGDSVSYIPISGEYSGQVFFDGAKIKTPAELRSIDNIDFLGNYINCSGSTGVKTNDNAKYLEIIPYARYTTLGSSFELPTSRLGDLVAEDSDYNKNIKGKKIEQSSLNTDNATTTFDTLSYEFYSNQFFNIKSDEQRLQEIESVNESDLSAAFILNTNKGTRLGLANKDDGQNVKYYNGIINQSNVDIILKTVSFVSNNDYNDGVPPEISLFGSPLYYAQNAIQDEEVRNYAKAYLFLNTLPLTGLYGDRDKIKTGSNLFFGTTIEEDLKNFTLFNDFDNTPTKLLKSIFTKNAGFIKSPSLWLAWLGSIIWRYEEAIGNADPIKKKGVVDGQPTSLVLARKKENKRHPIMPDHTELFHTSKPYLSNSASMVFNLDSSAKDTDGNLNDWGYVKIDKAILGLPEQAKDILISFFEVWAEKEFESVKQEYQLFNDSFINFTLTTAGSVEMRPWLDYLEGLIAQNTTTGTTTNFDSTNIISSGNLVIPGSVNSSAAKNTSDDLTTGIVQGGFDYNEDTFFLPYINIKLDGDATNGGNQLIRRLFSDISVIVNFTPRTFKYVKDAQYKRDDISVTEASLKKYLDYLIQQYRKLYEAEQVAEVDTSARDAIFGSSNLTFIKLNIYRHLKAIHDKWITNYDEASLLSPCGDGGSNNLIDRFLFIDKNWEEIGNEFIVNPFDVEELLRNKLNQTMYDVLSNIFSRNNFNFIPLPNYVEYNDPESMEQNIFKPYPYIDMVKSDGANGTVGPKFICMYIGQRSTHLDIKNSQFKNDGFDLNNVQDLIKKGGSKPIPAFEVNYGSQNQNYFKDLKLDQREFVETEESLNIIDRISDTGDKNKSTFASQNLFNVYQTRSYSAEVTALGMPLIQPMMYFQLNNIPMFRGAYVIINTSHTIKPNHMTTSFKGVRVKRENTPINKQVIAIKDLNIESSNIAGLKYELNDKIYTDGPIVETNRGGTYDTTPSVDIEATKNFYLSGFKARIEQLDRNPRVYDFSRPSNTKKNGINMSFNEIFEEVSKNTGFDVDVIKVIAIMESNGGLNKGKISNGMNSSGFVGLMQFGRPATVDVTDRINAYLRTKINLNEYVFFGNLSDDGAIIYPPSTNGSTSGPWPKTQSNDRTVNSMFDDYISTLAGVYYAIKYINGPLDNPIKIYLTHQQGSGGLSYILRNPDSDINIDSGDTNIDRIKEGQKGNLPPGAKTARQNQEWYGGWAGNVEAAAYKVNPNYVSKYSSSEFNNAKV